MSIIMTNKNRNNMKKTILSAMLLCALCACSSDDDDEKDMTQPEIVAADTASPLECDTYHKGGKIPFRYLFKDNQELGSYNIEIHNNFDHHTHSTSAVECSLDAVKETQKPWVFNRDFSIPEGQKSYDASMEIDVPADIDAGDYHFMVRLTDKAGWQQIKSVAIKIVEAE